MSCLDEDAVLAWLAGDLSGAALRDVESHIDVCPDCRRLVSELAADDADGPVEVRPSAPPLGDPGSILDERWLLEEVVGRGGMGKVFRARDLETNRVVAVKRVELDDARFAREARILAELAHPAIVGHVHDGVAANGSRYLVMEWLDGETLAHRLARGPLSVEETLAVARRVAEALGAAHASGVVHRDVKPSNIFLVDGRVDRAKIVDFGLARRPDGGVAEARTRSGMFLGTPGYMAPEQARGERNLGPPADVFALGCVLYECLTGARAFPGANVIAVLSNLLAGKSPRPRARVPGVPRGLDDLVARMLARNPARRPQNGSEVLAELAVIGSLRALLRRSNLVRGAAAALVITGLASVAAVARPHPAPASPPAPTASVRAITDATLPASTPPEAAAEYRAGIAAIRHAALAHARAHLEKALELDPSLAAAHLRLSLWTDTIMTAKESRAHYKSAREGRTRLDARDQELLVAVEPGFLVEPPDLGEATRRLRALAGRHPGDAELVLLGIGVSGSQTKPEDYEPVLALDPGFAYAWWSRANAQFRSGQYGPALASIDRCLAAAPDSSLCVLLRARIDSREGRCEETERDARLVVALEDGGTFGYAYLANALTARGADRAAVESVLHARALAIADPKIRAKSELYDRGQVAAAYGDFVDAEKHARALAELVTDEPFVQEHVLWAVLLVDTLEERGDDAAAGRVADDFLRRRPAWRSVAIRPNDDPLPTMLAAATRAGRRTPAEEERARAAWSDEWTAKLGPEAAGDIWIQEWARPAREAARLEESRREDARGDGWHAHHADDARMDLAAGLRERVRRPRPGPRAPGGGARDARHGRAALQRPRGVDRAASELLLAGPGVRGHPRDDRRVRRVRRRARTLGERPAAERDRGRRPRPEACAVLSVTD